MAVRSAAARPAAAPGRVRAPGRAARRRGERWRLDLPGGRTLAPPYEGVLYAGTDDGLAAVDAATGALRWSHELPYRGSRAVAAAGDLVFVGGEDTVTALDRRTGAPRWAQPTRYPTGLRGVSGGLLLAVGERPGGGTFLQARDPATGAVAWNLDDTALPGGPGPVGPLPAAVLAARDPAVEYGRRVDLLTLPDAAARWTAARTSLLPDAGRPGAHAGSLIAAGYRLADRSVLWLDADTGALTWQVAVPGLSLLRVADGVVYAGDLDGVTAIDAGHGGRRWAWAQPLRDLAGTPGRAHVAAPDALHTLDSATGAAVGDPLPYGCHAVAADATGVYALDGAGLVAAEPR
ncbi:hypothetical protein GCM10010123_36790 [Pilimelia anulata]|uniref:Pyrrolo-quinoline quinone repeat domain-containing protein n=1 Tax=Pilimelia anulata TaxID=53371 RepID=A0A8J3BBU3_9ACTN|nr:PQQ-binding-like beta-propeller repeat protein [Pilimelia anulata]GGK03512.1 hypothetical protein GCM10010123_36790 [Pilimelia anulata]